MVTVGLEPTSATSMVVTPHCGDHSLSVEKAADDKQVEPTSVRSMVVRSPWSGLPSPFRANKLESLPASQDSSPGCRFSRLPRRCERCALPTEPCDHEISYEGTSRYYRLSHATTRLMFRSQGTHYVVCLQQKPQDIVVQFISIETKPQRRTQYVCSKTTRYRGSIHKY